MAAGFPSFSNVYIPASSTLAEITANLVIAYGRGKTNKYPMLEYTSIVPVSKPLGFYTRISAGQAWRINPTDGNQFRWAPGNKRPGGDWNKLGFVRVPYNAERFSFDTRLDQQAIDVADFKLQPLHYSMLAQQAMVWRSYNAAAVATTSGNYPASHVKTSATWGGGAWSTASDANPYIMKSIQSMAQTIQKDTGNTVASPKDLAIVLNPVDASLISRTEEIRTYLARQEGAPAIIKGDEPLNQIRFGMPEYLYGCRVVIEDTVYNTDPTQAADSTNNDYVWPTGTVAVILRPAGQLEWPEGVEGNPSVIQLMEYEALNAEALNDSYHRLLEMSVTDQWDIVVGSQLGACLANEVN